MKKVIVSVALLFSFVNAYAQVDSAQLLIDSLESSLKYQQGEIKLKQGIGTLTVPTGFRYLDAKQSQLVLEDWWDNPQDTTVMGMIVPENRGMMSDSSWAFIITYEAMGYVK